MGCLSSATAVLFCATGFCGIGFYIYLLGFEMSYNEVITQPSSDWFDISQDVPWILGLVEAVVCILSILLGISSVGVSRGKCLFCTYGMFGLLFGAAHGFIFYTRFVNIGSVGTLLSISDLGLDPPKATCLDKTMTGCPTTRRESNDGECSFWYWDTQPSAAQLLEQGKTFAYDLVKDHMNWDKSSSYGYTSVVSATTNNVVVDPDQESTMKQLLEIQTAPNSYGMTIITKIDDSNPPVLTYCWYWGCDQGCMPDRHRANLAMVYASFSLSVLFFLAGLTSICASQFPGDDDGAGGMSGSRSAGIAAANNGSNAVTIRNNQLFEPYRDKPIKF